jgi:hypothetical protein
MLSVVAAPTNAERRNPTRLPVRLPDRESDRALSARPQLTAASSNTCWHTWPCHAKPVATASATPALSHGEPAPGVLGPLPRIKRVDQVKPGPRHLSARIATALCQCGLDHPQALIESKPRRPRMPLQHIALLDSRIEAERKRGMPGHAGSIPAATDNPRPALTYRAVRRPSAARVAEPSRYRTGLIAAASKASVCFRDLPTTGQGRR